MNNVDYLKKLIQTQKAQGVPLQTIAWNAARACTGWPYVYGAVGEECRPAKRRQYGAKFYPKGHTTIVTKCKALSWDSSTQTCVISGDCCGCAWYLPVMMFDCRGFTRKILNMVYGWTLMGGTVGGQWNDERNWKAKGEIATMPRDTLVCLFVYNAKGKKWQHTGFGFNDMTMEASSGVQYSAKRAAKWTHWAVPAVSEADVTSPPEAKPDTGKQETKMQTIRKGNKGKLVTQMQQMLDKLGYSLGICGVDGDYGVATEKAVREFQRDHGLTQDGVCGPKTWAALQEAVDKIGTAPAEERYTVTITGLTKGQADEICKAWKNATVKKE